MIDLNEKAEIRQPLEELFLIPPTVFFATIHDIQKRNTHTVLRDDDNPSGQAFETHTDRIKSQVEFEIDAPPIIWLRQPSKNRDSALEGLLKDSGNNPKLRITFDNIPTVEEIQIALKGKISDLRADQSLENLLLEYANEIAKKIREQIIFVDTDYGIVNVNGLTIHDDPSIDHFEQMRKYIEGLRMCVREHVLKARFEGGSYDTQTRYLIPIAEATELNIPVTPLKEPTLALVPIGEFRESKRTFKVRTCSGESSKPFDPSPCNVVKRVERDQDKNPVVFYTVKVTNILQETETVTYYLGNLEEVKSNGKQPRDVEVNIRLHGPEASYGGNTFYKDDKGELLDVTEEVAKTMLGVDNLQAEYKGRKGKNPILIISKFSQSKVAG